MNKDSQVGEAIKEAVKAGLNLGPAYFLPMSFEKQQELKAFTDTTADKADDKAYLSACCEYAGALNIATLQNKVAPDSHFGIDTFKAAIVANAIDKGSAMILNYENMARAMGLQVKRFSTMYFSDAGGKEKSKELIRSKIPLIIFMGKPGELNHVEAARGVVGEEWLALIDPGYQNDWWVRLSDLATGHFSGGQFVASQLYDGSPRHAYKFGWYELT